MARIKLVYVGGGSTRAAGTMASFLHNGADFDGSEVVLVDLDPDRLALIRKLAERMAAARGLDISISATTDRRAALSDCDAVLSSFRPAASRRGRWTSGSRWTGRARPGDPGAGRVLHGAAGDRRAQGALRRDGGDLPGRLDLQLHEPGQHRRRGRRPTTRRSTSSRCARGRSTSSTRSPSVAELDRTQLEATMVGLNHGCWSVEHSYCGEDAIPADPGRPGSGGATIPASAADARLCTWRRPWRSIPAEYFGTTTSATRWWPSCAARPTTRAQDIMAGRPTTGGTTEAQAETDDPQLDPGRSRGGIHELELAIDVMDASSTTRTRCTR